RSLPPLRGPEASQGPAPGRTRCPRPWPGRPRGKDRTAVEVTLVRVRPDGRKQAVSVQRDRSLIGRDTRCHLRIPSSAVSRRHAELRVEEGQVTLEDLGSSNGTYVNQE